MKKVKKSENYEPTIADVLEVVQTGFARHDGMFKALHIGQELLNGEVHDIGKRLSKTQNRVEDIADILEGKYEPRLRHLEKARV